MRRGIASAGAIMALVLGMSSHPRIAFAASDIPPLRANRWVNSAPLVPETLRGKVVLIDVWEYTCVNWIRTSVHVKAWHREYSKYGLVVIGVHAPEFEFGKRPENIDRGIGDHQLAYPIAIDNDFAIWRALGNDAWPAKYLFDADGRLAGRWIGEGRYDEVERAIRRLLAKARPGVSLPPVSHEATAFARTGEPSYRGITPETYVGNNRKEQGAFTLDGDWQIRSEFAELQSGTGKLVLAFTAGEVNLVAEPGPSGRSAITVLLDGQPIRAERGADVDPDGVARFEQSGMLRLVAGASMRRHVLTLLTSDPGTRAYVFTFGP